MDTTRQMSRLTLDTFVAFVLGCALIAAAVLYSGTVKSTAQGRLLDSTHWRHASLVHIGVCGRLTAFPIDCRLLGAIHFELNVVLTGEQLHLEQRFVADRGMRFRVISHVQCRNDEFFDVDCPHHPDAFPLTGFVAETHFSSSATLDDTRGSVAFLNLVYRVDIEGVGSLRGNRKYNDDVFLGTTWRWSCHRPIGTALQCRFVGRG